MSKFDNIIGYETIKKELMQICDMLKNKEIYESNPNPPITIRVASVRSIIGLLDSSVKLWNL